MTSRIKHPWSYVELDMLIAAIVQYGRNWKQIHEVVFPNITVKGIRDMFYKLSKEDPAFLNAIVEPLVPQKKLNIAVPKAIRVITAPQSSYDEEVFDWGVGELFDTSVAGY